MSLSPPITRDEWECAEMLCGVNMTAQSAEDAIVAMRKQQIKVVKPPQDRAIVPSRRELVLKRVNDMENEIGRLSRLARELRADVLELTIE